MSLKSSDSLNSAQSLSRPLTAVHFGSNFGSKRLNDLSHNNRIKSLNWQFKHYSSWTPSGKPRPKRRSYWNKKNLLSGCWANPYAERHHNEIRAQVISSTLKQNNSPYPHKDRYPTRKNRSMIHKVSLSRRQGLTWSFELPRWKASVFEEDGCDLCCRWQGWRLKKGLSSNNQRSCTSKREALSRLLWHNRDYEA